MRRRLAVPVLLLALAGTAACTGPADDGIPSADGATAPTAPPSVDDDQALLNFARCMRERGQNVPDPVPGGGLPPRGTPGPGWDAAEQACRSLLPGGGAQSAQISAEELEQLRTFAVCMREHDIPISDPEMPGAGDRPGNMTIQGRFDRMNRTQVENDPVYQAALAACQDKLPNDEKADR